MQNSHLRAVKRILTRDGFYSVINILGLALALTCGIFLYIYVESELRYDQHNTNHERIFRIVNAFTINGRVERFAGSSSVLGVLLKKEYPDLLHFVRFGRMGGPRMTFSYGETKRYWNDVRTVDKNIFEVFTHQAVYGSIQGSLDDPSSIVINETFSSAYFGDRNPIGETIRSGPFDFRITAVIKDLPDNSHLKFSALIPMDRMKSFGQDDEGAVVAQLFNINVYTYVVVQPGFTQEKLQQLVDRFYKTEVAEIAKIFRVDVQYVCQQLKEIHFENEWDYDEPVGNIFYVVGFIVIAILIVSIACINYTTLATARASKRSHEIAIRKLVGAGRLNLIRQFMGEAFFYTLIALLVGLVSVFLLMEYTSISELFDRNHFSKAIEDPWTVLTILFSALLISFLSGIYPAFYLSSIPPLPSSAKTSKGLQRGFVMREALVFLQFFISVIVLSATLVMLNQMNFLANKPIGYDQEDKLVVTLRGVDVIEKIPTIKNELLRNSNILGVSETDYVPGRDVGIGLVDLETTEGSMKPVFVYKITSGSNIVDVMGLETDLGRSFSESLLTDVEATALANETLVKTMGWNNPIGKKIRTNGSELFIIGVVKDFYFNSMHQPIGPMFIVPYQPVDFAKSSLLQRATKEQSILLNVAPDKLANTITHVESVISRFDPIHPFEYSFFDDLLLDLYTDENNLIGLTGILAGICIFISSIGLYALVAFTIEQREKEIGIRKVLGATPAQIIFLTSKRILVLMMVAATIGCIVSSLAMEDWLNSFAYRTQGDFWVFIASTLTVTVVTLVSIFVPSYCAANANPIDAIRAS